MYEGNPALGKTHGRYSRYPRGPPVSNDFNHREYGSQNSLILKLIFK